MELETHRQWLLLANGVGIESVDPFALRNLAYQIAGMPVQHARQLNQRVQWIPARERQQAQNDVDLRSLKPPEEITAQLATALAVKTSATQYQVRVLDELLVSMGKPT